MAEDSLPAGPPAETVRVPVRPDPGAETVQRSPAGVDTTRTAPSPAQTVRLSPADPALGTSRVGAGGRFGRYEIQGEIARGGMGVVYRARQADLGRTVALKVMLAGDLATEEDEKRFLREAEAAGQLSHPNIVGVHEVGREGDRHYFTMDLVEGRPLTEWGRDQGLHARLGALAKACRGVHHAHMRGILHRDLKPANILVTAAGEPKILDFGLAKILTPGAESMNTLSGAALGTPYYMAPEQAAGRIRELDLRTDVFALGVILYELVAGRVPFAGESVMDVLARIQQDEPVPFVGPLDLWRVAQKALEKDRARRYPTAEALAEDLERFVAGDPVSARPPSLVRLARRWVRRHPAAAASAAVALSLAAAALGWQLTRPGEIAIHVDVPGAWVRIDGRESGPEARVPAGRHDVRVGAPGYEEEAREMAVARGERRTAEFRLQKSTGLLTVETDLEGAVVEIEGKIHGTPVTQHALPVGDYVVKVRKKLYESRVLPVSIRRGEVTKSWVAFPPSEIWHQSLVDFLGTPVWLRDIDGDGVEDIHFQYYRELLAYSGKTGKRLRATPLVQGLVYPVVTVADLDGDGITDDLLTYVDPTEPNALLVRAFSGKDAEGDGSGVPQQKQIWRHSFPGEGHAVAGCRVVVRGGDPWVPVPGRLVRLDGKTGEVLQSIPLEDPAEIVDCEGSSDFVVFAGRTVLRFAADGRELWRRVRPHPTAAFYDRKLEFVPAGAERILVRETDAVAALDPRDGADLWRASFPHATPNPPFPLPGDGDDPGAVIWNADEELIAYDAVNGSVRFRWRPGLNFGEAKLLAAVPGMLLRGGPGRLVAHSARTGERLWVHEINGGLACMSAWVRSRDGGVEIWAATEDGLLLALDAAGRERREFRLQVPTDRIEPCDLNHDGRLDLVLSGNGIQALCSTRVLWSRPMTNAVRPRPLVIDIDGRKAIVLPGKWSDGRYELRCLDGVSGDVLWRYGDSLDIIFEPTLKDVNGDGVLDVCMPFQGTQAGSPCLSGRDGTELMRFPTPTTTYGRGALYDRDGDGRPELFLPTWNLGLQAWQADGKEPLWRQECGMVQSAPLLLDLGNDGRPELLVTFGNRERSRGWVYALDLDGRPCWSVELEGYVRSSPGALDVDGDGRAEIVVSGGDSLYVLTREGKLHVRWRGFGGNLHPPLEVAAADGTRELIAGGQGGVARLRLDGTPLWTHPTPVLGALGRADLPGVGPAVVGVGLEGRFFVLDAQTGRELWHWETGALCEGGVTLADLNGDGVVEAIFGSYDFHLYVVDLR